MSVYEDDYYVPSGAKGYAQMMARSKERKRFDYLMESYRKERFGSPGRPSAWDEEDYDDVMCPVHYWPDEREDVEDE